MVINSRVYILFFLIFIAFFLPLGFVPLFDLDEGAFSEATREMLHSGDYITTYLNAHLRFDKPILIYWLQLLSVKLFGINEFAFRFPSAVAGTIWVSITYLFTKKFFDENKAFYTALFMIASIQIGIIAKAAIADALLNLFIAATMFSIYKFYQTNEKRHIYLTFAFMALGTLTKGPVAVMIPFVVSFLFFTMKGKFSLWLKTIFNPVGIVIFMSIAAPWYIAEYKAQGQAFIDGFFIKHNLTRFNSALESHKGSYFYYVPVLLFGFMPFTYFALKAIGKVKQYFKTDLQLFLFIWLAFVFIFFSFSVTKLPHYVIYGYTPLFILSSFVVDDKAKRGFLLYPLIFLLAFFLFLPELALWQAGKISDPFALALVQNVYDGFGMSYHIWLVCAIIISIILYLKKIEQDKFIIGIALVMILTINYVIVPAYGQLAQQPIKEAALLAKEKGYKNIIMYKITNPTFNVYYQGLVRKDNSLKSGDIVFTNVVNIDRLKQDKEILYKRNGFGLIKIK